MRITVTEVEDGYTVNCSDSLTYVTNTKKGVVQRVEKILGISTYPKPWKQTPVNPERTRGKKIPTQKKISDLKHGQSGWIVPWACRWDLDGKVAYVDETFSVHEEYGGPAQLLVYRDCNGELLFNTDKLTHDPRR